MSSEVSTLAAVGPMAPRANRKPAVVPEQAPKGNEPPETGESLPPPQAAESQKAEPAEKEILEVVDRLREQAASVSRDLNFEVDRESGYTVIKVIDRATDEVVRQIPAEEVVERARQQDGEIALVQEFA